MAISEHLSPHWSVAYLSLEWSIRGAMLVIAPMRRSAAAARSWLLLVFLLPVPGVLLFLLIGRPKFPLWRAERFRKLGPFFDRLRDRLKSHGDLALSEVHAPTVALSQALGKLPAVGGNRLELLDNYDATVERLIADIDGAQESVRLGVYLFADDATGQRVIDALGRAVGRGVPCQVLFDSVGSRPWRKGTSRKLKQAGVDVREALPFRLLRARRTRGDMRNHRKLFLIDAQVGYAGSQNIVNKDFRPGVTNRELVVRATGPIVAEMMSAFCADWFLETEQLPATELKVPEAQGNAIAQLLPSGADYPLEGFATLLVWQIHVARQRAVIVTPYLIPDEALLGALRTAVVRGVTVDLVVSMVTDQPLVGLAQRSYYQELLEAGIRIYQYRDGLLHAKNVSVDGTLAIIGSSNVDVRSFQLNEEVSLLMLDGPAVEQLEKVQRDYIKGSDLLEKENWAARSAIHKVGENVARLVSPLL